MDQRWSSTEMFLGQKLVDREKNRPLDKENKVVERRWRILTENGKISVKNDVIWRSDDFLNGFDTQNRLKTGKKTVENGTTKPLKGFELSDIPF